MARLLALLLASLLCIFCCAQPYNQPLDKFVAENDEHYNWNYTGKHYLGDGWAAYLINMTSQMWLNETFVNKPIWWHWLWITVPTKIKHPEFATVVGTGGSNNRYSIDDAPSREDIFFIACQNIARDTGTICASLYQIPNEPLTFYNDPLHLSRSEDAIIAFGWNVFSKYDATDDNRYQWITHFPMAKATVRAMDTVSAFATEKFKLPEIKRFGVSGASKRGWSAWLTAAVDTRIEVMIPIVMDMCNFHPNLHHQFKAYGGWTWAFKDYYAENITQDLDDQFVVDGTYDEFFMPDDEQFWWDDFEQPKYFLINPDADHSQATAVETDIPSLTTFLGAHLNDVEMPIVDWQIDDGTYGNITLFFYGNTSQIVDAVVWHGHSCGRNGKTKRRDFRMVSLDSPCECGVPSGEYCLNLRSLWTPIKGLQPIEMNDTYAMYTANPPEYSEEYWEAFLIGLKLRVFENEEERQEDGMKDVDDESWFLVRYGEIVLTSQVSIVQKDYPFEDCSGETCKGTLV